MTTDLVIPIVERRPFVPFQLHLADGRVIRVPHSDHVTMERFALALIVYDDNELKEIIDIAMIVSVRFLRKTEEETLHAT